MKQLTDSEVHHRLLQATTKHGTCAKMCSKAGVSRALMSRARSGRRQVPRVIAEQCLGLWTRQSKSEGAHWNPIEYYEE